MYIADASNHRIRKVTASTGIITTFAGSGGTGSFSGDGDQATSATLYSPYGVAVDSSGTNQSNYVSFTFLVYFSQGDVYIDDRNNQRIRKVTLYSGVIATIAGTGATGYGGDNGPATSATLNVPRGIAVDSAGIVASLDSCLFYGHSFTPI